MKSKEEMITLIAEAFTLGRHKESPFYESCDAEKKKQIIKDYAQRRATYKGAEAALKALCGALPELTKKPKFSGFIDGLVMTDAPKLYDQLKQWGK